MSDAIGGAESLSQNQLLIRRLRESGALESFATLGIEPSAVGDSLASTEHHYYRYRWSVALGEEFREVIHAVPPEEELGWTPWERWTRDGGGSATHESWIAAAPVAAGSRMGWKLLDRADPADLRPLFHDAGSDLRHRLDLAGVSDALDLLGFDVGSLLAGLCRRSAQEYARCRWVVVPHFLADDGPVVYSIPSRESVEGWPWETWYRAGGQMLHHVHFDRPQPGFEHEWAEPVGAPQRPPEVLGGRWFWGDPQSLRPAMA